MDNDVNLNHGHEWPITGDELRAAIARAERAEAEVARLREVLRFYADAPRDEDGATMPLDMGERARAALADSEKEET